MDHYAAEHFSRCFVTAYEDKKFVALELDGPFSKKGKTAR